MEWCFEIQLIDYYKIVFGYQVLMTNDVQISIYLSCFVVYKDGMILRSGHSLRTLQSVIREHDAKQMDNNTNYSNSCLYIDKNISQRNALTTRKIPKSAKGSKQYSQSERKRRSMSTLESGSATYLKTKADLRARQNLSSKFDSYSGTNSEQYTRSNLDSYSKSKSDLYSNGESRSYDISTRNSKSYNETDSGRKSMPGYSVTTVRTTVTEYEDSEGGQEKAEKEISEKQARSGGYLMQNQNQTVDHLYGKNTLKTVFN